MQVAETFRPQPTEHEGHDGRKTCNGTSTVRKFTVSRTYGASINSVCFKMLQAVLGQGVTQ